VPQRHFDVCPFGGEGGKNTRKCCNLTTTHGRMLIYGLKDAEASCLYLLEKKSSS